jgi:hypothetical protein
MKLPRWLDQTVLVFMAALLASGCATGRIKVESTPDAAIVKLVDVTTGKMTLIGPTPVEIGGDTTGSFDTELLQLEVSKEGFETQRYWLPNAGKFDNLSKISVTMALKPKPIESSTVAAADAWNQALRKYVESQRLVTKRRFRLAESKLYEAMEIVGGFAEAKRLLGTIQYLDKRYENSQQTWREILMQSPNDVEAVVMLRRIQKELGQESATE